MSLVKESRTIRETLLKRLIEIYPSDKGHKFSNAKVVKDAAERNFVITAGCLSRYFTNKSDKSNLSEAQIIWLCLRYQISISLVVGNLTVKDGVITKYIPKYDEVSSLKLLKQIFKK